MLSNLNADPQNVNQVLSGNLFLIPEYQRPYSWKVDKCDVLWNDLYDHFCATPEEEYFLGSIVLCKDSKEKDKRLLVIDGQQRLITLSILLRVFYNHDSRNKGLARCLYLYDQRDEEKILGNRIESSVLGETESNSLARVLAKEDINSLPKKNNYAENYRYFEEKVESIRDDIREEKKLEEFIDHVLKNVYLLPIKCDNFDKALNIFETINNRGLELSPADIFKSMLYQQAIKDADVFAKRWDNLDSALAVLSETSKAKDLTITTLFRWYMSLLRAENNDAGKPVGVREFFTEGAFLNSSKKKDYRPEYRLRHRPWEETMNALERLKITWEMLSSKEKEYQQLKKWYATLSVSSSEAALAAMIFVYKRLEFCHDKDGNEVCRISNNHEIACENFLRNLARYVYAKGFDRTIEGKTVPDAMLQAAIDAISGNKFSLEAKPGDIFLSRLDETLSPQYRRGFCMLLELINPRSSAEHLEGEIEHILPNRWGNDWYDKWNEENASEAMHTLGNLVLLKKSQNIKASNRFFETKKKIYGDSEFSEAKDLCEVDNWDYNDYKNRHEAVKQRLYKFLRGE